MTTQILAPRTSAPPSGRTILAVVVTLLAWASAFVAIRGVGEDFSPGALALGRLLIGTAVLGLLLAGRGWIRPTGREWALLVVCGVGWFGIYNVSLNAAEQHLDAGTTAMPASSQRGNPSPSSRPAKTAIRIGPMLTSIAVVPASRCCSAALRDTL